VSAPLLEVEDLHKHFPVPQGLGRAPLVVRAVDGVSFDLRRGETLGLVGESGCGKSTLARLVVRLAEPTSGSIRVGGEDALVLRGAALRRWRRRVQIVFQDPYGSLNPRLTVGAAIREVLEVHGIARGRAAVERVNALLEQVGLAAVQGRVYPHELSGGQRQRVGIARALAAEPEILVLDEPVSALDVSVQAQILNLLRDLQARLGLTLLFISHDLRVVRLLCQRVDVMYLGRVVESGPAVEMFRDPRHPYTWALLRAVPHPVPGARPAATLTGEPPSPIHIPSGCRFHPRCAIRIPGCDVDAPDLVEWVPQHWAACVRAGERGGPPAAPVSTPVPAPRLDA
jgi:oligopeptide/dipeptide ABC transporter ATP-binding protein